MAFLQLGVAGRVADRARGEQVEAAIKLRSEFLERAISARAEPLKA